MGASQSNGGDLSGWENSQTNNKGHHSSGNGHRNKLADKNKKNKAKPSPPIKVRATDITHNSITLSWMPPRHVDGHSVIAYAIEISCPSSSGGDKQWKMLTKSCQGTSYEARHLEPNTDYVFRVRAENIYGTGKPSAPSELITTKMFDTLDSNDKMLGVSSTTNSSPEKSSTGCGKRQSFNMHLDGRVSTILSHSDIVLSPSSNANFSYSTTTLNAENNGNSEEKPSQTLARNNINRSSWQSSGSSRKISLPILLPGTATNSLNRLRESRNSLRTSTSDMQIGTTSKDSLRNKLRDSRSSLGSSSSDMTVSTNSVGDSKKKSGGSQSSLQSSQSDNTLSNSRDGCSIDGSKLSLCDSTNGNNDANDSSTTVTNSDRNNKDAIEPNNNNNKSDNMNEMDKKESNDDEDDDVYKLKEQLKNLDLPEDKLKFNDQKEKRNNIHDAIFSKTDSQKGYYESLDNPWEKDTSADGVSERIMTAPFCDDIKMALCAKNLPEGHRVYVGSGCHTTNPNPDQAGDFRALRSVLQGNNMIVKTNRSLPEVVGLVMGEGGEARTLTRGTLTTIMDVDEDEDPVRVTTL